MTPAFFMVIGWTSMGSPMDEGWFASLLEEAASQSASPRTFRHFQWELSPMLWLNTRANEPNLVLQVDEDSGQWNVDELGQPVASRSFLSGLVRGHIAYALDETWFGRMQLSTGEIRGGDSLNPPASGIFFGGRSDTEWFRSGAIVEEAYVQGQFDPFTLRAGRARWSVADGLLADDFMTGADMMWREGRHTFGVYGEVLGRTWTQVRQFSPLLGANWTWDFGLFERLEVGFVRFLDQGGIMTDLLLSSLSETVLERTSGTTTQNALDRLYGAELASNGSLSHIHISFDWLPASRWRSRTAGVFQWGRLEVQLDDDAPRAFVFQGGAMRQDVVYSSGNWEGTAYGLALSGDQPTDGDTGAYGAFVGLAPIWDWTGLFFNGGINQGLSSSRALAAGVNGHGVWGGGVSIAYLQEDWSVESRLFGLTAWADRSSVGSYYGTEWDVLGRWSWEDRWSVSAEMDVFWLGSFFTQSDVAYRFLGVLGARLGD